MMGPGLNLCPQDECQDPARRGGRAGRWSQGRKLQAGAGGNPTEMGGPALVPAQMGFAGRSSIGKATSGWWAGVQLSRLRKLIIYLSPQPPQDDQIQGAETAGFSARGDKPKRHFHLQRGPAHWGPGYVSLPPDPVLHSPDRRTRVREGAGGGGWCWGPRGLVLAGSLTSLRRRSLSQAAQWSGEVLGRGGVNPGSGLNPSSATSLGVPVHRSEPQFLHLYSGAVTRIEISL